jgi:flagellar motor switch protein FliG
MSEAKMSESLSGKEKAAILMISLGPRLSGQIFKHLSEDDIEQLTLEIASFRQVQPSQQDLVIQECLTMIQAQEYVAKGGMEYAQEILERGLGVEAANQILSRLTAALQVRPFDFARKTDPSQLLNFIQHEHPQTIALILAYLHADQASMIIGSLPPELQVEVAKRLATLDQTTPEVVEDVEGTLERKLSAFATDFTPAGGIDIAVDVLNRVDRTTEKTILKRLEEDDPELAEAIRKRMFVFENIVSLADRDLQKVIREVDTKDWPYALKAASEEVCEAIYRNMSKRQAEMIKEDMEFLGPVRLRDVEDAQQRVVGVIRRLEDSGDIIVSRGGEDDVVV